jgi:serine/threonine protein kinase
MGTLHGARRTVVDATWIPYTGEDRGEVVKRTTKVANWLETPRRRLVHPLGVIYGDGGMALIAKRVRGRSVADLRPVKAKVALALVTVLLYAVEEWFADAEQIPLTARALDPWSLCIDHQGGVTMTYAAPGTLTREEAVRAIGACLETLTLHDEEELSVEADLLTAISELTTGFKASGEDQLSISDACHLVFDLNLRADILERFALRHAMDLGPHGGTAHPWQGKRLLVQHWKQYTAPDITPTLDVHRTVESAYAVRSLIAEGGMGRILSAWDPALQREVALKVLFEDGMDDKPFVARFLREIRLTAKLDHPAIVPVYSLETTDAGTPAFTMKHVHGINFHHYLKVCVQQHRDGELDAAHALPARLEHFVQACDAVAYAHSRGVLHRDLKLENLMVGQFHEVYVMDWGVARSIDVGLASAAADESQVTAVTQAGDIVGTESYMSPEQAHGLHESLTPASDQFSLGLVLYELVALLRARGTDKPDVMLEEARGGFLTELEDLDDHPLPSGLRAIILRATAFNPDDRYPDVAAFAEDVRAFLTNQELMARPDSVLTRNWRRLLRSPVRTLNVMLLIVAVAAIIAVSSLVSALRSQARVAGQVSQVADIVAAVGHGARDLDLKLHQHELLLQGLAAGLSRMAQDDLYRPLLAPSPQALKAYGIGVHASDRRQQLVSFDTPILHRVPHSNPIETSALTDRLGPSVGLFRRVALRRSAPETLTSTYEAQQAALAIDDDVLQWTLAGFEAGAFLSFPGHDVLPPDYDPRTRPWYLSAQDAQGVVWGAPHPDSAGTGWLLAASTALRADDGTLLGVAGVELELSRMIDDLRDLTVPAIQRVQVIDAHGVVMMDTKQPPGGTVLSPGLLRHLAAGDTRGLIREDQTLIAYDQLSTNDWSLVVTLGAEAIFIRPATPSRAQSRK